MVRKRIRLACRYTPIIMCAAALLLCRATASAQGTPSPSPSPQATPSDPCGSILSIVNRPTIGTGVCTVRSGRFDIESGWLNSTVTGMGAGNVSTYGATLLRFGTSDPHLDLEITPPLYNTSSLGNAVTSGWSDAAIGAKYELGYSSNADWGVNAELIVPTGSQAFSGKGPQYAGNFNWGYTINSVLGVNGTVGFNELRAADSSGSFQSYFAFIPTFEATATLPGPSQFFAEYAYFSQAGSGLGAKSEMDFGYIRDFGSHLQFDVEFGVTPTVIGGQRQRYFGAGFSFMN